MTTRPTVDTTAATFERADVGRWGLWFALTGGVIAWLIHFLLAYAISEFGCVGGWDEPAWLGLSKTAWALIAVTGVCVALAGASILVALRARRRLHDQRLDAPGEPGVLAAGLWMAYTGFVAGIISLLVILVQGIPIFYWLGDC